MTKHHSLLRALAMSAALGLGGAAAAEPISVEYFVHQKAFKSGVNGTDVLDFRLYEDADCSVEIGSYPIFANDEYAHFYIDKNQRIRGGKKLPKAIRIRAMIDAPMTASAPYLQISGPGIVPVGEACQLQGVSPIAALGPQGDTGPAGVDGAVGPQGPQGETGAAGPAGADGATGTDGAQGATGPAGADGATGAQGETGPAGAAGADGAPGADGAQGATGPAGSDGATGETGLAGAAGADGATGAQGETGPLDRIVDRAVSGHDDHRQVRFAVVQLFQYQQSIHIRHADILQYNIADNRIARIQAFQQIGAPAEGLHQIAAGLAHRQNGLS